MIILIVTMLIGRGWFMRRGRGTKRSGDVVCGTIGGGLGHDGTHA